MILGIVQARMSSTRLPGKVLRPIQGRPMLARHLDRLKRSKGIGKLVLATSREPSDGPVAALGIAEGVAIYRGSLNDVLARFHGAAEAHGPADHIVRLTADCPLADWRIVDDCIALHLDSGADYTSNILERTYPDGLDVEVMRTDTLNRAARESAELSEREHVTPYIYKHPEYFRIAHLKQQPNLEKLRWTVDTPADFEMVSAVYDNLLSQTPDFGQSDILRLLEMRQDIDALNSRNHQQT